MAPGKKAPASGRGKASKLTSLSMKRPTPGPNQGGKPKVGKQRNQLLALLENISGEERGRSSKYPTEIKPPASLAARKQSRATPSMMEIFASPLEEDEVPRDFAAEFLPGSTALSTWGAPSSQPVPAVRQERRSKGLRGFGISRGRKSGFARFMYGTGSDDGDDDTVVPFRFLDLPLEIRWEVYGYLLVHPKPILIHPDWRSVHSTSPQDHTVLRTCKKILLESTQFLYEKNIFHVVVNPKCVFLRPKPNPNGAFIKTEFLPCLRNVILECHFEPSSGWSTSALIQLTAKCLGTLVKREAQLDSMTLVLNSTPEATDSLIASDQAKPVVGACISECFSAPSSKIMRIIPSLRCKLLNIIVRMPERKRVLVSLNLRALPVNLDKGGWLAGERVAKLSARKLAQQVREDLLGLERRLHDIFEDCERAVMDGKARLMGEDENQADGVKLASRGQ